MGKINNIIAIFSLILLSSIAHAENKLRIPLNATAISLDSSKIQDVSSLWVSRQISCQLVRMKAGTISQDAADNIHYTSPLEITVQLKKGIYFTNGSELTADDVIASFNYLRSKRNTLRNVFNWIDEIIKNDRYEIVIKLNKPIPQLLKVLAAPNYAIFEKDFIKSASKNPLLWKYPVSCGNYKVTDNNNSHIKLTPVKKGIPLEFILIPENELNANETSKYDIIALEVSGKSKELDKFNALNVFDPFQYYFVFNAHVSPWNSKAKRCDFLSKLNPSIIMDSYGDKVKAANDFLPSGTLGYSQQSNFISYKDNNPPLPSKHKMCVAFVSSAVEKYYRDGYINMVKKIYPDTKFILINGYNHLNEHLDQEQCDGVFLALKSNYLDAYEYLIMLSNKGANATGYYDNALAERIEKSQNIEKPEARANEYREIINKISNLCLVYPLFTMPYEKVFVNKSLTVPDIGKSSINDYDLSQVYVTI